MVLMLTEKFEIDKLLFEKSMRKTNSCYERHKCCTLLGIYFDLKCNKAWVKEEAGFWIFSYSLQQDRCQIFLFFFFNQIFWFSEIPERTTYMHLLLAWDWFSSGTISHQCIVISFFVCNFMCWLNDITMHFREMALGVRDRIILSQVIVSVNF